MKFRKLLLIGLMLCAVTGGARAEEKLYKDGRVINMTYIKIKPGRYEDYMRFLDSSYKAQMEAFKKAGLIVDYAVLSAQAAGERAVYATPRRLRADGRRIKQKGPRLHSGPSVFWLPDLDSNQGPAD